MFEQHPVPQNIASYQFRLVGDMTLSQFFQLAGGALVGLLIYSLPLPAIFKWPLIALSVIGGAALAFLPVQERPLALWMGSFFRSIYSPTFFVWQKLPSYQFFAAEAQSNQTTAATNAADEAAQMQVNNPSHVANLEEGEKTKLNKIMSMLNPVTGHTSTTSATQQTKIAVQAADMSATQKPLQQPVERVVPKPQVEVKPQVQKQVVVPRQQAVKVEVTPQQQETVHQQITVKEEKLNQTLTTQKPQEQTVQANFSPNAAPPTPPDKPNVIVGQVMDNSGKIIEGAILEIKDEQGRPVRALKTNKAGHFLIVTPLNNGKYTITTEKENYSFEVINFEAKGENIEPIAIRAK